MADLRLSLLGAPHVTLDGEAVHIERQKALALLAYLSLSPGEHRRDTLATLLWPESDTARTSLRGALFALERALGGGLFTAGRQWLGIRPDAEITVDLTELEQLLAAFAEHGHAASQSCERCPPLLQAAVSLYNGDFLAGFNLPDAPDFDAWQLSNAERARALTVSALERLISWHAARKEWTTALDYAQRWTAIDPLSEPAYRAMIEVAWRSGQRSTALRIFDALTRMLAQELGAEPADETLRLHERILAGTPPSTDESDTARESASVSKLRLGLKRLSEPATAFVGRDDELRSIRERLIERSECRLLTLTGPGGVGKTRLALEIARREQSKFADGVAFVSLAAAGSEAVLIQSVAGSLDVSLAGRDDPVGHVIDHLRHKRLLLVLDNCEQVIEEAGGMAARLLGETTVTVLATSRESLGLNGEWRHALEGLPAPALDEEPDVTAAVRLFLFSAERASSDFSPDGAWGAIAEICRLVDGLPLAIELAASWTPVLSCDEIAAELRRGLDLLSSTAADLPDRHRNLRAVFEQSRRLLSDEERRVLQRLSVFQGGFDRSAAAAVAGAELPTLAALIGKSLLRRTAGGRYEMLEVLRQYAAEALAEGEAEHATATQRHADWYIALLGAQRDALRGPEQSAALTALAGEIENLRAAWRWASERRAGGIPLPAADSMFHLYQTRSWLADGDATFRLFEQAVARSRSADRNLAEGKVWVWRGWFASAQGRNADARALFDRALARFRALDARAEIALTLSYLAEIARSLQEYDAAAPLLEESLALYEALGDGRGMASVNNLAGVVACDRGDYDRAYAGFQMSLGLYRRLDDPRGVARALANVGLALIAWGRYEEAATIYEDALAEFRRLDDRSNIALALNNLGFIASARGDYARARALYGESLDLKRAIGDRRNLTLAFVNLGQILCDMDELDDAEALLREGLALCREIGDAGNAARMLTNLGQVAGRRGRIDETKVALREALATARDLGIEPLILDVLVGLATIFEQFGHGREAVRIAGVVATHRSVEEKLRGRAQEILRRSGHGADDDGEFDAGLTLDALLDEVLALLRSPEATPVPAR